MNAELEARGDFRQRLLGAFAPGKAVGDDADVMAAIGLAVGEIEDMAENATDRRARCVQDTKRLTVYQRHDQNQRSSTSTSAAVGHGIGEGTPRITGFLKKYPLNKGCSWLIKNDRVRAARRLAVQTGKLTQRQP